MSNKAYSFFFNASDWLSSPAVKLMSKAERGTYIDLLAIAWVAEHPGTLPASEDKVRRLAELSKDEWAESSEVLLEKFPLSECGSYRYNPRLLTEVRKQQELSEKNAENGRRSAERRAAEKAAKDAALTTAQRNGNENPTTVESESTTVGFEANESSTKISKDKQPTNVGKQAREPEPSKPKPVERRLPLPAEDVLLFNPADWPSLKEPARFAQVCAQLGFSQVDFPRYRLQILASLEGREMPAASLRNWIKTYLNNDSDAGKLLLAPVQVPNDIPSNWPAGTPYTPPTGGRIPNMSEVLNPNWKPPQA